MRRGWVDKNPCQLVPKRQGVKLNNERRFVLDKGKFHELLKVLSLTPDIHDLVLFAAKTGLRFGKITSLTAGHVHADTDGTRFIEIMDHP